MSTMTKPDAKGKEAKGKDDKDAGDEAPKSKKKLIIIAVVALLAIGGGAYFFLFAGSSEPAAPEPGIVLSLEPVAVNLAGGGYLKVGIALQFTLEGGGAEGEAPDGSRAQDLIIAEFSQAQPADVATSREALKADLQEKIIEAYEGDVMAIYYTQYVTQ